MHRGGRRNPRNRYPDYMMRHGIDMDEPDMMGMSGGFHTMGKEATGKGLNEEVSDALKNVAKESSTVAC